MDRPTSDRPIRWLEIGCGDGALILALAGHLKDSWPKVELWLVDRSPVVDSPTLLKLRQLGWEVHVVEAEVNQWLDSWEGGPFDLVLANLFLHHFTQVNLSALFRRIQARSNGLIACEPRRSMFNIWGAFLLGLIGCNRVTRQDAILSVRAGFQGDELSRLWNREDSSWQIEERSAGLFTHFFSSRRKCS